MGTSSPHPASLLPRDPGAKCPRCGYDQRGVIAAWTDSCPLHGTCTECGLHFSFGEVLRPHRYEPRWCVEFVHSTAAVPRAALRTVLRSLFPWHFWAAIRMAFPVRKQRLLAYVIMVPLILIAVHGVQQAALAHKAWTMINQAVTSAAASVTPAGMLRTQIAAGRQEVESLRMQLRMYADMESRNQVPRGFNIDQQRAYTRASIEAFDEEIADLSQQLSAALRAPPPPPPPMVPLSREMLRAIFTPLSALPGPQVTAAGETHQFPAPIDLCTYTDVQFSGLLGGIYDQLRRRAWVYWSPLMLIPACFVLLPFSRRRANVRWIHIVRVTGYSIVIPVTASVVGILAVVGLMLLPGGRPIFDPLATLVPFAGVTIWAIIWWAAAVEHYLRMPHAWPVAVLLCIVSLLLAGAIHFYTAYGMSLEEIGDYLRLVLN